MMLRAVAFASVLAALAAGGCGSRSVPPTPAYDVDVRPILMARCVRCHGGGGMLNAPPGVDGAALKGTHCFLDRFADEGDCTADPDNCKYGAQHWAGTMPGLVRNAPSPELVMPPPPSVELDDWAVEVLTNWANEKPKAVCSNSADPDPNICPPGTY
jgi:hypothetical protein